MGFIHRDNPFFATPTVHNDDNMEGSLPVDQQEQLL
jgi:hypothetical protein